jgi:hypothetical protein
VICWEILGAGAAGALISEIIQDNCLIMPEFKNGTLILGSVGGIIVGACAGYLIDGSPLTAFMGGYMGKSIVVSLINGLAKKTELK